MKSKRPVLSIGLSITLLLSLCYIISAIFTLSSDLYYSVIILFVFIIVFILNYKALKTVDLSAKDFKKGKWYSWILIIIIFLYDIFEYILIIKSYHANDGLLTNKVLRIALLFITFMALLLCILGICTKVIDNKITYEEHLNKQK
jgi:hypothetical protein